MHVGRWIGLIAVCLLLALLSLSAAAQAPVAITLFIDENSLTVYVPGNQVVSLQDIAFEITYPTGIESYPLSDYFMLPWGQLPAPFCLRLEHEDGGGQLETQCPAGQTFRFALAEANVFWYDTDTNNPRIVVLMQNTNRLALCVGGIQQGCQLTYIPPTWTPTLTPVDTSAPSATPIDTLTPAPTDTPLFVPTLDIRAAAIASVTAAIEQTQTAMPTPTLTPSFTLTWMPDIPATQAAISTEIVQTAQAEATLIAQEAYIAGLPFIGTNDDWMPIIRQFDGVPMALVPAGCFMMGSTDGENNEQPVERICIENVFWIDVTEVTQAQFTTFGGVKARENHFNGNRMPIESITWFEARDYCEDRRGMRLLTEAEWEFAARGTDGLTYTWGNEFIAENVVYDRNSNLQTANVGSHPGGVSWVGALDLSGNVQEWMSTIYHPNRFPYPYRQDDGRENNRDTNSSRVRRGGSWANSAGFIRATYRTWSHPISFSNYVGFRCAASQPQ